MANIPPGQVKKHLNGVTLLCLAFVICNSWAGIAGSLQLALLAGGPSTLIYSILVSTSAYLAISSSLAELASVYPTAGGQYHFTSILAPKKWRRGLSYACGILSLFSWLAIGVSVTIVSSQQLLALVSTGTSGFEVKRWHVFFCYEGFALLSVLYNTLLLKRNPWTHNIGFALTIVLFLVAFISLLVRANPKQSHEFVWDTLLNFTGWPDGVCFLIGLSTSCYMYIGVDASMHMAEECSNPERAVPRTMVGAIGIGFTTGFAYAVAQVYAIYNVEEIMLSSQWIPFLVLEQGLRSRTFALVLTAFTIVMALFIIIASQETSSRMVWALARDHGLVFSRHLEKIDSHLDVPIWGLFLVWLMTSLCGFLYLASQTAFNAIVGSSVIFQQLSFAIPILLLLMRKRSTTYLPPTRTFSMPNVLGWTVNIYALSFITLMTVILCLPFTLPTDAATMNYTSVILGLCLLFGLVNWWLHAKTRYNGPVMEQSEDQDSDPVSVLAVPRQSNHLDKLNIK
ncbi:amino acid transporter [Aspergillus pseudoustus]|uniref:Amino acid transporter n=1 Tax=Aspergillus pseudoustus TaxID=1810923 RepID=A0ABR4JGV7_9EURO